MKDKLFIEISLLVLLLFLAGFNTLSFAQVDCATFCIDAGGNDACKALSVTYDKKQQMIELGLGKGITYQDLGNTSPQSWVIVDITESKPENNLYLIRRPERGDRRLTDDPTPFINVLLYLNQSLKPGHEYRIFQSGLKFQGCTAKKVLEAAHKEPPLPTTPQPVSNPNATPTPKPKTDFFPKSKAKGRDDANVFLSGTIEGARKNKTQFSTDIKIDLPLGAWGFFDEVGPFLNLRASTADAADTNSISFGAKFRHVYPISRKFNRETGQFFEKDDRILTGVVLDFLPGFETERRFKNVNAALGTRLTFVPRTINPIYFQPFIGYEIGINLKAPVPEAERRTISRGLVGSSLYIDFPAQFKGLSFQIDYVRRFLINREVRFDLNKDKKFVPVGIGKGPRDYVKAGFVFNFTDFAGATLKYEYGSLPPNFQFVDSKFSFGLVYKYKTTFPSK